MKHLINFLSILLIGFNSFTTSSQIIGGRANDEMTPRTSTRTELSGGGFVGDVNVMTGEYNTSIPLGSVTTPSGIGYNLELNNSSSFSFSMTQPMSSGIPYGEGWSPNIPTISISTDDFHKYSCGVLNNDGQGEIAPHISTLNFNETTDEFSGTDEGDLYWFAPIVNVPGVGSGRAVFKYVDVQDDNCVVFAMNKFESPIEVRFYGTNWVIIAANGDRYEFGTHLANYKSPSNQRVLFYNQSSTSASAQGNVIANGDYGGLHNNVLNVIEPKTSYSVFYCDRIFNPLNPGQGVRFVYKKFGKFNYFKEFDQDRYQQVRQNVLFQSTNTAYDAYSDILLEELYSYVLDSRFEILELDYETLFQDAYGSTVIDNDIHLDYNQSNVFRKDELYSYTTVQLWDRNIVNNTSSEYSEDNFWKWKRYKHLAAHDPTGLSGTVNPTNPYINSNIGSYHTEAGNTGQLDFDHGFLESPRILGANQPIYPGDIYEIKTQVRRDNSSSLTRGNGTIDIAIRTGINSTFNENTTNLQSVNEYNSQKKIEVFSTHNSAVKWQMGQGQSIIETSNLFTMPNVASTRNGFNIQVGPGNSDIDFSANPIATPGLITNTGLFNVLEAYPSENNNGRLIKSTAQIPHNFGTGHPWSMMIPVSDQMAYPNGNILGPIDPQDLYRGWWATNADQSQYQIENLPTKFDASVHLDRVELIRYAKNPYMLQAVRFYRINGEDAQGTELTQNDGKITVNIKRLEYKKESSVILRNLDYGQGDQLIYEPYVRSILLLSMVKEVPLDLFSSFNNDPNIINNPALTDTSKVLTTYLGYRKYLDNDGLNFGVTYDINRPYQGIDVFLLHSYVGHLGGITKIDYYPLEAGSPSRYKDNYMFSSCANYIYSSPLEDEYLFGKDAFNRDQSYTVHPAVHYMSKNDEDDVLLNSNVLNPNWNIALKTWEYVYDLSKIIYNPQHINLPQEHFRQHYLNRYESAFGKTTVKSPFLSTGERNYVEYEYWGANDVTPTMEEYLYYGKLKSQKNYTDDGVNPPILQDEKIIEYGNTLAFINGFERPNYMREQLAYDDQVARTYEYEDIYLNDELEVVDYNNVLLTGDAAKKYVAPAYITGSYTDREMPKMLEFYFYDDIVNSASNPVFMLNSYFIKKKSEISKVYDNSAYKQSETITTTGPATPILDKYENAYGDGIINPIPNDGEDFIEKVALYNPRTDSSVIELVELSPLSDSVLIDLVNSSTLKNYEISSVLFVQNGLSNLVWKEIIDNIHIFTQQDIYSLISAQPYYSDTTHLYLVESRNPRFDPEILTKIFLKNDYITNSVLTAMINSEDIFPGTSFADIVQEQSQLEIELIDDIINSSQLKENQLYETLKNQSLSDAQYLGILSRVEMEENELVNLLVEAVSFPSESVIIEIINREPSLQLSSIEQVLQASNRSISTNVRNELIAVYGRAGGRVKVPPTSQNSLDIYCSNPILEGRDFISTKTEYEYFEADYRGMAQDKGHEILFGFRSDFESESKLPFNLNDLPVNFGGDNQTISELRLKHEPSWQVFSVTTSSDQHPDAYSREEYFYLYDLRNRYERHWYNINFDDQGTISVAPVNLGPGLIDTFIVNPAWGTYYYNNGVPILPQMDGMERTRKYGNRVLAFQKTTISKNTRDQKPLKSSEYYRYDKRWTFDDVNTETNVITIDGDPCPTPPPNDPCENLEDCSDCFSIFYKPHFNLEEIVPAFFCAWEIPGEGFYACPDYHDVLELYPDAIFLGCNNGVVFEEPNKALTIGSFLSNTLQLRDVVVQVDTVDHSSNQMFDLVKMDDNNNYVAEFILNPPSVQDEYGFESKYEMIYPFDNLKVRKILERNRYYQTELEENQIGLQTKYYFNESQRNQNVFNLCPSDNYSSVTNIDIGLPTRICVGFNKQDSISTVYAYNDQGLISGVVEASGKKMNYTYDNYNRLIKVLENGTRELSTFEYHNWNHDPSLDFMERTNLNYVQTRLNNDVDPVSNTVTDNYETRKAFIDPIGRNQSVVSAYEKDGFLNQIHSGSVTYDNWGRTLKSYKSFSNTDPQIKAENDFNQAFAETIYENDGKGRALRSSNYGVNVQDQHVVKTSYLITNDVYTACELDITQTELQLLMGINSTSGYRFMRTEVIDQDDKRSVSYSNALGQKIATLKYNGNQEKLVTLFAYDSYGNLNLVINPLKQKSNYDYNILGQLIKETTVDAGEKKYMYNKQGLVSVSLDQQGAQDETLPFYRVYKYDDFGRLISTGRKDADFSYNFSDQYGPLHYETTLVSDPSDPNVAINYDNSQNAEYFDYIFTNASTQDWLASYYVYDNSVNNTSLYSRVLFTDVDQNFDVDFKEKEFLYGTDVNQNPIAHVGKLVQTKSYNNNGIEIQSETFTYDAEDNILKQVIDFNSYLLNSATGAITSIIEYPSYNYRNSLLEEKVDVNGDLTWDYHCFMTYDKLNRLIAIHAAAGEVSSKNDATLLVTYEHDDANGLITKKEHHLDITNMNELVAQIEYKYDIRDRLTNMKAGNLNQTGSPMVNYDLKYDAYAPYYIDGITQTVDFSQNYNGNINGTVMSYNFNSNEIANNVDNFDKPTLYGYTYDKVNRLVKADATVGDYLLQTGTSQEILNSYRIGDLAVQYDKIGNIKSLLRTIRGNGVEYTEDQDFDYNYVGGNNRLESVSNINNSQSRVYTYDASGNLLTDDYRQITGTEYGRNAYAFKLIKEEANSTSAIDYLYSVNDLRIFKRDYQVNESGQNVLNEDYYIIDAMGKTVAIRSSADGNVKWNYFVNAAERECRLTPTTEQTPGVNNVSTPNNINFDKEQATFYIYDHLGNTRVTYTPEGSFGQNVVVFNEAFNSTTSGFIASPEADVSVSNGVALVETIAGQQSYFVHRTLPFTFTPGQEYRLALDIDNINIPHNLTLTLNGIQISHPLSNGANEIEFIGPNITTGNPYMVIQLNGSGPYTQDYQFSIDNIVFEEVHETVVNRIDFVADYFPYGKMLRHFNGTEERYLTTQHERDQETGLDYRGARYYDADVARFLSLDPLAIKFPAWSAYNYVVGNPIIFTDPTGKAPSGDYYDYSGAYLGTDEIDDGKVYVASGKDEHGNYANREELDVNSSEFSTISNVVKGEASANFDYATEMLYIAHTANNRANAKGSSLYRLLMSGYSSASGHKHPMSNTNSERNNAARRAVISVMTGGEDPTYGAQYWDGTDFLAWGLNSPNGTPQNKFEEYSSIEISSGIYINYLFGNKLKWGNSVRYSEKPYSIPSSVFLDESNWGMGRVLFGGFNYNTGARGKKLIATQSAGASIFWKTE